MSYFVTGATGFIGRLLVERLLEREGDIHVLVREGSREKLDALIERWGAADRIKPVPGDLAEPMLGVSEADRKALEGVEHFFHLAAIYDMTADETRNALLNVGGTQNAVAAGQRGRGGRLPPRLLHRRRRPLQGPLHRGHVRRGPGAAHALPPDEVRVREARPREGPGRLARLPPGGRRRQLQDRRDGQDRRPLLLLQGAAEAAHGAAAVGAAGLGRVGLDEPRAGRLRRRRDRPHRPRGGPRRPGVPHRRPQGRSAPATR